jgi:hypothetical protein
MTPAKQDSRLLCSSPQLVEGEQPGSAAVRIHIQAHRDYKGTEEGMEIVEAAERKLIKASMEQQLPEGCSINHATALNAEGFSLTIPYENLPQAIQAQDSIHMAVKTITGATESRAIQI